MPEQNRGTAAPAVNICPAAAPAAGSPSPIVSATAGAAVGPEMLTAGTAVGPEMLTAGTAVPHESAFRSTLGRGFDYKQGVNSHLPIRATTSVRWGLIGAGDVCEKKSGPPLYRIPGHSLLAVTRRDAAKGVDFARRHGPSRFVASVEALLAVPEINAVYVATPPGVHAAQTIAAAEAGKHVLVEKPMAMDARECGDMIAACRANGVLLAVAYYRRGYPSVQRAKELIGSGRIGTLRRIWLNDQFPPSHRLDLVHYFAGELATLRSENVNGGARLRGHTPGGCEVIMNLGWNEHPGAPEQLRLTGDAGEIFIDDLKGGSITGCVSERLPPLPWTHWGLIEDFGRALATGTPSLCGGGEGRKSTVVLDAVSAAEPDAPSLAVDYLNPPPLNAARAAAWNLLG